MAGRPWEPWELEAIRDIPPGELARVARELGRSVWSVLSARHRYGLSEPRPYPVFRNSSPKSV